MSNLRLLDETSGTGVSTMTVSDVFSDNFKIYKIALYASSATEQETHIQLVNSNGSIITASNYEYGQLFMRSYGNESTVQNNGDSKFRLITGSEDNFGGNSIIYVFNPTLASSYTYIISQMSRGYDYSNNNTFSFNTNKNIGLLKQQNSITGFHIFNSATTSSDYKTKVYGIRID